MAGFGLGVMALLGLAATSGTDGLFRFKEWNENAASGYIWTAYDSYGRGNWQPPFNAFLDLYVTNNASFSNVVFRSDDSTWVWFSPPGTPDLALTNTPAGGRPLFFNRGQGHVQIPDIGGSWAALSVRTNLWVDSITLTNNIGYKAGVVLGLGGANTNFTILANNDESIIYVNAGTTNVNITGLMSGSLTIAYRGTIILTNRTATPRLFSLGSSNLWNSLQKYDGITAPFTVTNSQAGRFEWELVGTNVQYSYKPVDLPTQP
jgi:hypothetical protein